MKKKNRGFTLIELLAVIVILAIIALIAVPSVIKILNKARMSSAEDSVYGIVKSVDTYIANFMLKNDGSFPKGELIFNCTDEGCKLDTNLTGYNLKDLEELNFKGSKPTSGKITISNNGKDVKVENIKINGFTCNYPIEEKVKCYTSGDVKELLEIKNIGLTQTIDSIKVVVNASGNVKEYEYSIDGVNYYKSTDNIYIFNNLNQGTEYTVYVRVSNGSEKVESNKTIGTLKLGIPEIEVEKDSIWTQSKTVTIKYPSGENLEYSYLIKTIDGNTIIKDKTIVEEKTTKIEVEENSIVIGLVTLSNNNQSISKEVNYIDRTVPTNVTLEKEINNNSIKIIASGKDIESGVYGYQFSIDNGTTWLPSKPQKNNTYTFNNLNYGDTYNSKIRVINNTYLEVGINEFNTKESNLVNIEVPIPEVKFQYLGGNYVVPKIDNNNFSVGAASSTAKLILPISGYSFDWYQTSNTGSISFCDLSDNCERLPYSKCDTYSGNSGNYCVKFGDTYINTEPGYIYFDFGGVTFNLTNIMYNNKNVNISILPIPAPTPVFYSGENCTIYSGYLKDCSIVDLENVNNFSNNVYVVGGTPQYGRQIKINDGDWTDMSASGSGCYYSFTENGTYKFRIRTKITADTYSAETEDFYLTIKK